MKNENSRKLKVGIILDSTIGSKYIYNLAKWGSSHDKLTISHLIVQGGPRASRNIIKNGYISLANLKFSTLPRRACFSILKSLEHLLLKNTERHKDHGKMFDLTELIKHDIRVSPITSRCGTVYTYSDDDLNKIREEQFDVLIQCGTGVLRGGILKSATLGIIGLHYGDSTANKHKYGPPGFLESYLQVESTGFLIRKLTDDPDIANVLFRGKLATKFIFLLNQAALYEKSYEYLKKVLSDIAASRELLSMEGAAHHENNLFAVPSISQQFAYLTVALLSSMKKVVNKYIRNNPYRWGVAFVKGGWKNITMSRGVTIAAPDNRYLADPFLISFRHETYCFVEDFGFSEEKGCISVYKFADNFYERIGKAIVEPFHMSFPYVFEYQDKIYMCPETHERREIRVYECEEFPLKWKLKSILMSNISAADTMIFRQNGLWWMFTNTDTLGDGDHSSELSIFYSEDPLSNNWKSHRKNPIFVDSTKSRNAGILCGDDGIRYRVSQRQGFDFYGKATAINRIITLNENDYSEEVITTIQPDFFENIKGTHHLSSNGKFTAFDFFGKI